MPSAVLLAWVVDRQSVAVKISFVIRLSMLDTRQPVHPDRYFRRHSITVVSVGCVEFLLHSDWLVDSRSR